MPELLAATLLLGVVAAIGLSRLGNHGVDAKRHACSVQRNHIDLQVQLWKRNKGVYPLSNLSDIGASSAYFPDGLPTCPVDGSSYTLDPATHQVVGHAHP